MLNLADILCDLRYSLSGTDSPASVICDSPFSVVAEEIKY